MNKKIALILINYKDYANKYLDDCLLGIKKQDIFKDLFIYIVDNASSDSSYEYLKRKVSNAKIIRNKNNDGFAKGNNDAIKDALSLGFEYILLLNMDTVVEDQSAFSNLLKTFDQDNKIGAVQSRLMLWPEKSLINSLGNKSHFLGFGFCSNYGDLYSEISVENYSNIFYPSGAAVLFKSSVLKEVSLFDETYFMYSEDQDLGWRIWLAGYRCVLSLDSVVYHKYEFSRSISKFYYMDRNRIITILKNYKITTLILILPAFIIMEFGLLLFSLKNKWFSKKIKVLFYFLKIASWKNIIKERKIIQKNRKISDSDLFDMISWKIDYQEVKSPLLSIANYFFSLYFTLLKIIVKIFKI